MASKFMQPKGANIGILKDGRTVQKGIDDIETGVSNSAAIARFASGASQALFPLLMAKLTKYRHGVDGFQKEFIIHGYGSSVSNGATLPSPATQTPVAKFFEHFNRTVNRGGIYPLRFVNKSVDGSAINHFLTREWPATEASGEFPDLAVFAYGMNDFPSAQYNAGVTFGDNGFRQRLKTAIQRVRDRGGDVVILTTPHPYIENYSWSLPDSIDMVWPKFAAKPVADEVLIPPVSESNVKFKYAGVEITQGVRFLRGNDIMREVAVEMGCVLLDAERYWFAAVAKYGNSGLYNPGQLVHPNLFGHQQSYWRAIEEFFDNVDACGWIAPDVKQNAVLDVGGTGLNPAKKEADIDLQANGTREKAFVIRDKNGRIVKEVLQDGTELTTWYTVPDPTPSAPGYKTEFKTFVGRVRGLFHEGDTHEIMVPNRTEMKLMVNVWTSVQTGWTQMEEMLISNREGVITIASLGGIDTTPQGGSGSDPTINGKRMWSIAPGTNSVVITVKQNNSSLKYRTEAFGT